MKSQSNNTSHSESDSFFEIQMNGPDSEVCCSSTEPLYQRIPERFVVRDRNILRALYEKSIPLPGLKSMTKAGTTIRGLIVPWGESAAPALVVLFRHGDGFSSGRIWILTDGSVLLLMPASWVISRRQ